MRLILIGFHLYFLLVSVAFSAPHSRLQAVDYAVYIGGFHAVNINLDISLDKNNYDIRLALNTEGLADKLFKWSMIAFSNGDVKQGAVMPRKAGRTSIWRGKKRRVWLTYAENGFPNVSFDPKPKLGNFDRIQPPILTARDLAGAIFSYLTFAGNKGTCVRSEPIYDGKRSYRLLFGNQASVSLKRNQYSPFGGPTLRCQFKLKKIAGFRQKSQRYTGVADGSARVWLARIFSNATMVPVRIEMDTTFGGLFIHLISAKQTKNGKTNKFPDISKKLN
jgi:hypothetical protein